MYENNILSNSKLIIAMQLKNKTKKRLKYQNILGNFIPNIRKTRCQIYMLFL